MMASITGHGRIRTTQRRQIRNRNSHAASFPGWGADWGQGGAVSSGGVLFPESAPKDSFFNRRALRHRSKPERTVNGSIYSRKVPMEREKAE